jgi:hypothetical protein
LIFLGDVAVPTEPIDLTLDDKQFNCSSGQVLSIGMLKISKIKCLIFLGHVAVPTEPIEMALDGQ